MPAISQKQLLASRANAVHRNTKNRCGATFWEVIIVQRSRSQDEVELVKVPDTWDPNRECVPVDRM